MRISIRFPMLLTGAFLLPALALSASAVPDDPPAPQPAHSIFHLFTKPLPAAPALPLENIPIGSSSEGGTPHLGRQSRMALKGERLLITFRDDTLGIAALALSTDGGRTFSARSSSPVPGQILGAPEVAFGLSGELLFLATPPSRGSPAGALVGRRRHVPGGLRRLDQAGGAEPPARRGLGRRVPVQGKPVPDGRRLPLRLLRLNRPVAFDGRGQDLRRPDVEVRLLGFDRRPVVLPNGTSSSADVAGSSGQVYRADSQHFPRRRKDVRPDLVPPRS